MGFLFSTARGREEEAENRDVGQYATGEELQRRHKAFSGEFCVESCSLV